MTKPSPRIDDDEQLLRRFTVEAMTGLGTSGLYELIDKGLFPEPVPLTRRRVAWVASEVKAWIRDRIAASRTDEPVRLRRRHRKTEADERPRITRPRTRKAAKAS